VGIVEFARAVTKIDKKSASSPVKEVENVSQNPETGRFSGEFDERSTY
jgi:hypothetical protein